MWTIPRAQYIPSLDQKTYWGLTGLDISFGESVSERLILLTLSPNCQSCGEKWRALGIRLEFNEIKARHKACVLKRHWLTKSELIEEQ